MSLVELAPEPIPEYGRRVEPAVAPLPIRRGEVAPHRRRRVHWRRWAALLILLCVTSAGIYWSLLPPAVAVIEPHRGPAIQAVYATGTVEPTVMIPIAPRTATRLAELRVDEGSAVKEGQVLARLENRDLQRAIAAAAAEEQYAKAELDRQGQLVARGVAALAAYDRARADWEKARALRERAEAEAGYLDLVAPADGRIIRRDGEIGQVIGPDKPIFWMSCCAPLRVSAEVDEEDIAQVRDGQEVLIRADAFPGQIFRGTVQSITPKGDPVARTYRVRVSLTSDTPLMIGMTAETNIVLRKADSALLVPAGAVQQDAVWRVADGKLEKRKVAVGAKDAREVEIMSGLGKNDRIVASPTPGLKAGDRVRPFEAAAR